MKRWFILFALFVLSAGIARAQDYAYGNVYSGGVQLGNDILSESKILPSTSTSNGTFGKAVSVANNGTQTLLNLSGIAGGFVNYFFLGWNAGEEASTMVITADGNTVFSDRAVLFFGAEYQHNSSSFAGRYIGAANNGSTNVGFYSFIPIPFTSSISITFTNKSGGTHTLYWTIAYQSGVPNLWPRTRKLVTRSGTVTGIVPFAVTTLVNDTSLNPGRLFGVAFSIDSIPGSASPVTGPLEGEIKIYLDGAGSPNYTSSGTEDYFGMSNYFEGFTPTPINGTINGVTSGLSDYTGGTLLRGPAQSGGTWNGYRFHILDPITFQNAIKYTWDAGETTGNGGVTWTGTVRFAYCLYYYTE